MQPINLKDLDITQLQSLAYQMIVQREEAQRNLITIEQEIRIRIDQQENAIVQSNGIGKLEDKQEILDTFKK